MEVFSLEGSHGYDLMGYTKEQVITDVLDHYEQHLEFLTLTVQRRENTVLVEDQVGKDNWEIPFQNAGGSEMTTATLFIGGTCSVAS